MGWIEILLAHVRKVISAKPKEKVKITKVKRRNLELFVPIKLPTKTIRTLSAVEFQLQEAFRNIKEDYEKEKKGLYTLVVTTSFRPIKIQQELYKKGRTKPGKKVTNIDGIKRKGKHNCYPSKAIDVAVKKISTGRITWKVEMYKPLVRLAKKHGVKSGGSWKGRLRDYPHLEV